MTCAPPPIIGQSPAIKHALALVERYAPTGLSILLVGASGTGKELFAQHIHYISQRSGELVDVDCGVLPEEMVEALLFGYRRGAFTGAIEDRVGLVEESHGGTLFLDEVLSLTGDAQRKLLRALDTREVRRLGDVRKRPVDLRVVGAVQDDVGERLARGALRRDLYERLAGIVIRLPPLVERPDDVVPLARYFAAKQGQRLEPPAEIALKRYDWPGNVRELRKVIQRAWPMVANGTLPATAVIDAISLGVVQVSESDAIMVGTRSCIPRSRIHQGWPTRAELFAVCEANRWSIPDVARAFGVHRTQLYARFRAAGTSLRDLRKSGLSAGRPAERSGLSPARFS